MDVALGDGGCNAAAVPHRPPGRDVPPGFAARGDMVRVSRLPDTYFDRLYASSPDPWQLGTSWYERRKYAVMLSQLTYRRYRNGFEPGCSVGVLTHLLTSRCDHVTATDVSIGALDGASRRLRGTGRRDQVTLLRRSIDEPWPPSRFDLVVLSDVAYYLSPATLRGVLDREVPRLHRSATVVATHWRHPLPGYPMSGDRANDLIAATRGLYLIGSYRDNDVAIDVFDTVNGTSVAARARVPGARD